MEALVRELQALRLLHRSPTENSMHIAAVLRVAPPNKVNSALILSIGVNSQRRKQSLPFWGSMHAECDAVGKLPKHAGRRPLRVDLLVVRTNRSGGTANSRPCRDCLVRVRRMSASKNIVIDRFWFTDQCGNLAVAGSAEIDLLSPHISYAFRRATDRDRCRPKKFGRKLCAEVGPADRSTDRP